LIVGGEIGLEMGGLESLDALRGAEDRPPRRLIGKGSGLREVEYHVLRRILGRGDLLQDHVALAGKLGMVEARGKNDVAQDIQREAEILAQHPRVIGGRVDAGGGVELAADRLDLLGDGLRAAPVGALEGHMLEKMRDAVLRRALAAAAGADPEAERYGLHIGPCMAHYGEAIPQSGYDDTHAPTPVRALLAALRPSVLARAWLSMNWAMEA
jgi:hypothetical protein